MLFYEKTEGFFWISLFRWFEGGLTFLKKMDLKTKSNTDIDFGMVSDRCRNHFWSQNRLQSASKSTQERKLLQNNPKTDYQTEKYRCPNQSLHLWKPLGGLKRVRHRIPHFDSPIFGVKTGPKFDTNGLKSRKKPIS